MKKTCNFLLLTALFILTACTSAIDEKGYTKDSLEGFNRKVFAFNEIVDKTAFKPVARAYEVAVPQFMRTGIHNFFGNLSDVGSFANAALQLDGPATAKIGARVVSNTVIGIGGLIDVATPMGNEKINRDFGSTLARYGVQSGPFVMLPFFGPSTLRDAAGKIPGAYLNPVSYIDDDTTRWSLIALNAVDTRASFLPLERQMEGATTDKYAAIRDAWLQHRWGQLGTPVNQMQSDDIDALFAGNSASPATTDTTANNNAVNPAPIPANPTTTAPTSTVTVNPQSSTTTPSSTLSINPATTPNSATALADNTVEYAENPNYTGNLSAPNLPSVTETQIEEAIPSTAPDYLNSAPNNYENAAPTYFNEPAPFLF
ncbi:MAG: VacJ family lipoprotein [Cardiobacteriaceae bacterium]|nr:VacJ family lipoprotein [Cardiobacteriaceae bacterium]